MKKSSHVSSKKQTKEKIKKDDLKNISGGNWEYRGPKDVRTLIIEKKKPSP